MSYQKGSGTPRGFDRPKKAKAKQKSKMHRVVESFAGERGVQSRSEVVGRTLSGLENLGNQSFAMAPFHQYFDRWLLSLQTVLDDFEASNLIEVDNQFTEERIRLFSIVEAALTNERTKGASREEAIRGLNGSKSTLFQVEQEYSTKLKELSGRRDHQIKSLTGVVEIRQGELDEVVQSKSGLLEGITKTKAKKEEVSQSKLTIAKKELEETTSTFVAEEKKLQEEYNNKRQEILKKIAIDKIEIEKLEAEAQIDNSTETRHIVCENLAESVNSLIKRGGSKPSMT